MLSQSAVRRPGSALKYSACGVAALVSSIKPDVSSGRDGEHCEYPDFASNQLREDLFSGSFPLYNPADACHFHAIFTTSGPVYGTGTGSNPIVPVRLVLVHMALFWRQPDRLATGNIIFFRRARVLQCSVCNYGCHADNWRGQSVRWAYLMCNFCVSLQDSSPH